MISLDADGDESRHDKGVMSPLLRLSELEVIPNAEYERRTRVAACAPCESQ